MKKDSGLSVGEDGGPAANKDRTEEQNREIDEIEEIDDEFYSKAIDILNDESFGTDPQQPAKPVNEYGGFVRSSNTRRNPPRSARTRAKRPRECC